MKFEHQASEGVSHIGPETKELDCFYCKVQNLREIAKSGPFARHVIDFDQ